MDQVVETALAVDVAGAVTASVNAAVNEASRQADLLIGGRPVPGGPQWLAEQGGDAGHRREVAAQLLHFRIILTAGVDPLPSVVGLRRWGVTWELIARAAGVSRQAAHERWGRRVLEVLDGYGTGELGGPVADDETDLH
ncbi:hypothetical protein I0C86_17735 [Plantactinospora sp. S1510]|uniref:Uncharacterized protein n=1 Tax=Plantactinospora alkalitolerans TaxID=2789879 RepID=A0ABS0GXH9_9ACTN|nr:hypothetical protein [Plantactinospora alkalitolerans]MBF9130786.1 hypothetical protein [Plantactinospora alkalitolerans]